MNLNLSFPICWAIQDLLLWPNCVLIMPTSLGFYCLYSCAYLSPSHFLWYYFPLQSLTGASPSCNPGCDRTHQSPAVSGIQGSWDPDMLGMSKLVEVKLPLGSSNPGITNLLRSCVRAPGSEDFSWCCKIWWGAKSLVFLWTQMQAARNPCLCLGGDFVSLVYVGGVRYTGCWARCCALSCDLLSELECPLVCLISVESCFFCDPVILGISDT